MFKRLYWIVTALLFASGIAVVVYFSLEPKSVPKIKLSQFATPLEAAAAVHKRLDLELRDAKVLMIGVWPGQKQEGEVLAGLLKFLHADAPNAVTILDRALVQEESMAAVPFEDFGTTLSFGVRDDVPSMVPVIQAALAEGKKVFIVTASYFSSQLLGYGPASKLVGEYQLPITSISMAPFPLDRTDEARHEVQCITGEDGAGTGPLGCNVIYKARSVYRKKKDPNRWNAMLDLVGGRDYLWLIIPPQNAQ